MIIKPKSISYKPEMIRAQLEGRKTQTRRVLTKLKKFGDITEFGRSDTKGYDWHFRDKRMAWNDLRHDELLKVLPYQVGDLLWVREPWQALAKMDSVAPSEMEPTKDLLYVADRPNWLWDSRYRQAMHMPRWASRLTNEVTDVRIERLQDISEEDALAEGIERQDPTTEDWEWYLSWAEENGLDPHDPNGMGPVWIAPGTRQNIGMTKEQRDRPQWGPTPEFAFRCLWNSINDNRGFGWDANPWVIAITFIVHACNVDELLGRAA